MMKKSKILCKTVQIKDLSDEKIYTPRGYKENAELKKFVNKKISESIAKTLGDF